MQVLKPIAIHDRADSFSSEWIDYCEAAAIPYKVVSCYDDDILAQLDDCSGLMWHWSHLNASDANFARQLIKTLESRGFSVFPDSDTSWHFDDKLGQKYLFEAHDIPHVPTHVFYGREEALRYVASTKFPLVFKLARGAGSKNVRLVTSEAQARRLIRKSFSRGWVDSGRSYAIAERLWAFKRDRTIRSFLNISRGIGRFLIPRSNYRTRRLQSGYVLFQDFIPNNDSDIRIVVIGGECFGFRRFVRDGDFRASGSGRIDSDPQNMPQHLLKLAVEVTQKLNMQVAALDFILDEEAPKVVEVSYGFGKAFRKLPGYWDSDLEWVSGEIDLGRMMVSTFLRGIER